MRPGARASFSTAGTIPCGNGEMARCGFPGPVIAPCFPGILGAALAVARALVTAAWSGPAVRARRASAAR
jgi:hypothetical protein